MDDHRFDNLVRSLTDRTARRTVLRTFAGGALGALLAGLDAGPAAATRCAKAGERCGRKTCCTGAKCRKGACQCKRRRENCDGRCVNLATDRKHCGGCGKRCPAGHRCRKGACDCVPKDLTDICAGRACGETTNNCGDPVDCGTCPGDEICRNEGACVCPNNTHRCDPGVCEACCINGHCTGGQRCENGACCTPQGFDDDSVCTGSTVCCGGGVCVDNGFGRMTCRPAGCLPSGADCGDNCPRACCSFTSCCGGRCQ